MNNPYKKNSNEYWMNLALQEAAKGRGRTSPNPMVGAVLVRKGKLLATGYHRRAGLPHAEIEALKKVKNLKGATMFVTLEPCCHKDKRTPPCVDALIQSGVKKVVIACPDPNPKVAGKGIRLLKKAGIQIEVGILEKESRELNLYYNHWVKKKEPWIILKSGVSLDGRVALANGRSQWITHEASRKKVHQLRSEVDAILVGIGTILSDNPRLTARQGRHPKQPLRIVLDPHLKIPLRAKVLARGSSGACWILTGIQKSKSPKARRLVKHGVEVIGISGPKVGKIDLKKLKKILGAKGICSLLLEGGPGVWTRFIREGAFEELYYFVAPKFLGADAKAWVGPLGLKKLPASTHLQLKEILPLENDALLRYRRKVPKK